MRTDFRWTLLLLLYFSHMCINLVVCRVLHLEQYVDFFILGKALNHSPDHLQTPGPSLWWPDICYLWRTKFHCSKIENILRILTYCEEKTLYLWIVYCGKEWNALGEMDTVAEAWWIMTLNIRIDGISDLYVLLISIFQGMCHQYERNKQCVQYVNVVSWCAVYLHWPHWRRTAVSVWIRCVWMPAHPHRTV